MSNSKSNSKPSSHSNNRLSRESSPYLLMHAQDPVDWYPWGEEALTRARDENKPIFLSIGYSACHWCHLMAAESFSDADTARILNESFINIKVDREERPDLDKIYHNAFQLLNGKTGGWPLTAVLTPDDQIPFFAAAYLASQSRNGFPGFAELMQGLANYYHNNEAEIRRQNQSLQQALSAGPSRHGRTGYSLNVQPLQEAISRLKESFDATNGGFGEAPKFPQPLLIERLLRHYHHTQQHTDEADTRAGFIAKYSLEKMAQGGIYDQAGGGFFRYALDAQWQTPNAEKMLCDNAQLLALYSLAWQLTKTPRFKTVTEELADWALGEMQAADGGFYSSVLVADNENRRDEKILCAWNALMIKGLARAGRYLQRAEWIEQAQRALDFIRSRLWQHGRLCAVYYKGQVKASAYLDDYVLLIDAILELLQCRWRDGDLNFALDLAEVLLNHFQDPQKQGGFYYTADDHETLIQRPKPLFDDALPAGNGVAAQVLIKLGHLTNSIRHLVAAERALKNAWPSLDRNPLGCCAMLLALEEYYYPSQMVVIRGSEEQIDHWRQSLMQQDSPRRLLLMIPDNALALPEFLASCAAQDPVVAYVCSGSKRSAPITDWQQLEQALQDPAVVPPASRETLAGHPVH